MSLNDSSPLQPDSGASVILQVYYPCVNDLYTYLKGSLELPLRIESEPTTVALCTDNDSKAYIDLLKTSYVATKADERKTFRYHHPMLDMREVNHLFLHACIYPLTLRRLSIRPKGDCSETNVLKTSSLLVIAWWVRAPCILSESNLMQSKLGIPCWQPWESRDGKNGNYELLLKYDHYSVSCARVGDFVTSVSPQLDFFC